MSTSALGRKALFNGNIQLAEHYFSKAESVELEITQEILENRAYFSLYFRKYELAESLINSLEESNEKCKLLSILNIFKGNLTSSFAYANKIGDQDIKDFINAINKHTA
eukprot:NODE_73_length_24441_cov_0.672952.p21 type:complete len:109 gc:universal NODE_73_length_24441_cov_0.672952:5800-5474(-)